MKIQLMVQQPAQQNKLEILPMILNIGKLNHRKHVHAAASKKKSSLMKENMFVLSVVLLVTEM